MKKYTIKHLNFINILLVVILCITFIFFTRLLPYDELWNFQNVFKMSNGFKIYQDANVIITPLFFYIGTIFFKLFGANFLVFRLINIFLILFFFFFIYKIQKNLKISKNINLLFLLIISFSTYRLYIANGANYNVLAFLFYLIGINAYISKKNSNIFQGIILFLIFLTKQTTAIFYFIGIVIYEFYEYRFSKKFFTNQIKKIGTFLIPTVIFVLVLLIDNNLINFVDYTFGGLLDFSKNNFTFSPEIYDSIIIFSAYILSISLLFCKKNLVDKISSKDFFDNLVLIFIFATCSLLTLYPICNAAHVKMVVPFFFILLTYIFDTFFREILDDEKSQKILTISITIFLAIFVTKVCVESVLITCFGQTKLILEPSSPYFGVRIDSEELQQIEQLKDYVTDKNKKGVDVIICSSESAFVMIPLKQSHGAYDLMFYGNLGYNGIENMKQDILSKEHTEFLVLKKEDDMFKQEITEIRDFITENLSRYGEFLNYDVYIK